MGGGLSNLSVIKKALAVTANELDSSYLSPNPFPALPPCKENYLVLGRGLCFILGEEKCSSPKKSGAVPDAHNLPKGLLKCNDGITGTPT